jgi:beta-galactosidase/beta-glucuronidase
VADPISIDAAELTEVRLSTDRTRLSLTLRDAAGRSVSLSLPTKCLNAMLTAVPQRLETGTLHALDSWSMDPAGHGEDMVLTLRTAEGLAISFAAKSWQVEGMATIATYGRGNIISPRLMH